MERKSSSDHYGAVAVSIHWITAVLILILIGSGFRAADTLDPAVKATILRLHVPIAVGVPERTPVAEYVSPVGNDPL